jgi:DNA-binding MarR family transcriptional regulator
MYFFLMSPERSQNVFGALSLAIADGVQHASQAHVDLAAPAAAITLVGHIPGLTILQLSHALNLSHPGAVRLVDRLEDGGLMRRERSQDDGRAVGLHLTAAAESLARDIHRSRLGVLKRAMSLLSAEEQAVFGDLAEKMLRGLIETPEDAFETCRLCDISVCAACPVEDELRQRYLPQVSS